MKNYLLRLLIISLLFFASCETENILNDSDTSINREVDLKRSQAKNELSCGTSQIESSFLKAGETDYLHQPTGPTISGESYCVKVYIHRIMPSDGFGGLTDTELSTQVTTLQSYFDNGGDSGIEFIWDGVINDIKDDALYEGLVFLTNPNDPANSDVTFTPVANYTNLDGIDLFFMGTNNTLKSFSNKLANKTEVVITKGHEGTAALAHEVGHVFGLFHTYHGTIGNGNDSGENNDIPTAGGHLNLVECPSQSSSVRRSKGDFVSDTPPDKSDYASINNLNCTTGFDPTGNIAVCDNENFGTISTENIMGDARFQNCFEYFTLGQKRRMLYFIRTRQVLQNAIASSCNVLDCRNNCNFSPTIVHNVDGCTVEFDGKNTGVNCDGLIYEWKVDGEVKGTSEDFIFDFSTLNGGNGSYTVTYSITNPNAGCKKATSITINPCEEEPFVCPPASCLDLIEVSSCRDFQVWMNCNDPDIDYIKWYYTIGNYNHVYAGISGGNPAGQHAQPIYLPQPSFGNTWDGYVLTVYGEVVSNNGDICDEIFIRTRLSCSSGGTPIFR